MRTQFVRQVCLQPIYRTRNRPQNYRGFRMRKLQRQPLLFQYRKSLRYRSEFSIDMCSPSHNLILIKNNAIDGLKVDVDFDIVYMRWFLHAIPYSYAQHVFECAVKRTKPNGRICVEVRSLKDANLLKESVYDEEDESYSTTHKRWPSDLEMLRSYADLFNCRIVYEKEDCFSPNPNSETSDPLLIRMIFQKK
jgi:hypothetical protein